MPKLKNPTIKQLKLIVWRHFSLFIRNRDNWTCITCGAYREQGTGLMQAGHYVARGLSENLRYSERNVFAQCTQCNKWKHGNMQVYAIKLVEKFGAGILSELNEQKKVVKQWTIPELQALEEKYKNLNK